MNEWQVPSVWESGDCWIIAGGSSWLREFNVPEELITATIKKQLPPSSLSPYLEPIHDKHIIGVNNAYQIGNWIDILFFGDCCWYLVHQKAIANFPGIKVTCCNRFAGKTKAQAEGIKYVAKDRPHKHGITSNKSKVSWNGNSGAAAINLAAHLGVKRIILLGFDMALDDNRISHWHGSHTMPGAKVRKPPFQKHLKGFPAIAIEADARGLEIINASPNSAITQFPKMSVKELL
jgi:hypothetical protein